ncbi:MAG: hypothetical protein WA874_17225, partial [Chryseosolibacter sp.]
MINGNILRLFMGIYLLVVINWGSGNTLPVKITTKLSVFIGVVADTWLFLEASSFKKQGVGLKPRAREGFSIETMVALVTVGARTLVLHLHSPHPNPLLKERAFPSKRWWHRSPLVPKLGNRATGHWQLVTGNWSRLRTNPH